MQRNKLGFSGRSAYQLLFPGANEDGEPRSRPAVMTVPEWDFASSCAAYEASTHDTTCISSDGVNTSARLIVLAMYAQILRSFSSSPFVGDFVLVHRYEIARKMSGLALVHTYKYAITRRMKSAGLSAGSSSVSSNRVVP